MQAVFKQAETGSMMILLTSNLVFTLVTLEIGSLGRALKSIAEHALIDI
jgi:hypothetical protein